MEANQSWGQGGGKNVEAWTREQREGAGGINGKNDSAIIFSEINRREMRNMCLYLEWS